MVTRKSWQGYNANFEAIGLDLRGKFKGLHLRYKLGSWKLECMQKAKGC